MTGRELAWRVFAHELRDSSEEERGTGEKSPSYVISPLGARMNRVLVSGTIGVPEQVGPDSKTGIWRAVLTDPTGTVSVTAGAFQPRAQVEMQNISSPTRVLIVGKVALLRGTSAEKGASVRAETVRKMKEPEYRALAAETAAQTFERVGLLLRLRGVPAPTDEELARSGVPPSWSRAARASNLRYPPLSPAPYYETLRAVLVALREPVPPETVYEPRARPEEAPQEVHRVVHPRVDPSRPEPRTSLKPLEGRLLEILDELAEGSPDGYADMDDLSERAAQHGLDGERVEELLNYLSENGTVEEPLVGKFRRADGPPRD